jgi:hypothetical protein
VDKGFTLLPPVTKKKKGPDRDKKKRHLGPSENQGKKLGSPCVKSVESMDTRVKVGDVQ